MSTLPEIRKNIKKTLDDSNLLRAILILIEKDKNIWDHEARIFIQEGIALGYDKEFCEDTIKNILQNSHINRDAPVFFNKATALKFLRVGIRIIQEDVKPHPEKNQFLEKVAYLNNLKSYWDAIVNKDIKQIK